MLKQSSASILSLTLTVQVAFNHRESFLPSELHLSQLPLPQVNFAKSFVRTTPGVDVDNIGDYKSVAEDLCLTQVAQNTATASGCSS